MTFVEPAKGNVVSWSQALPFGAMQSRLRVQKERGLSLQPPTGTSPANDVHEQTVVLPLYPPGKSLDFSVKLPTPSPANRLAHACRRMRPDRSTLVGKPLAFKLPAVSTQSALDSLTLRGKPHLVNLMATWDALSKDERPHLKTLHQKLPTLSIVMIASSGAPAEDLKPIAAEMPFPMLLDKATATTTPIGAVTKSWRIDQLPESVLVDKKGIVRFHFRNWRKWSEPAALRCLAEFVK